uniref:Uncharacterized protein n=1 Tax=Lepeophtheirus salmonis TaxID=72036 RepID=A0A0K2V803_LEPSM
MKLNEMLLYFFVKFQKRFRWVKQSPS